ncbi:putative DNA-binding protein [Caulobacter sp. BE264]|uniref:antitoxin n=1 Tax=Caulobacter sp. BE264 TaxID=2817724 RepID=UPI00285718D2|nr:antitoxin [Caulobacter sp. BE264]MDR7231096.1 putative DNA-binding protein [Caulobacter sp. BE264]
MADGFDIHIDQEQAARLKVLADRLGMTVTEYAVALIDAGLTGAVPKTIDPDPTIDEAIADAIERGDEPVISRDEFRAHIRRVTAGLG